MIYRPAQGIVQGQDLSGQKVFIVDQNQLNQKGHCSLKCRVDTFKTCKKCPGPGWVYQKTQKFPYIMYCLQIINTYYIRVICCTFFKLWKLQITIVAFYFDIHVHHRGKRLQRCQQGRPSPFVPINVDSYPKLYMCTLPSPYFLCLGVYRFCVLFLLTQCHSTYHDHDDEEL